MVAVMFMVVDDSETLNARERLTRGRKSAATRASYIRHGSHIPKDMNHCGSLAACCVASLNTL